LPPGRALSRAAQCDWASLAGPSFKEVSRLVSCNIQPVKVNEFKAVLNNELLPRIQAQPGFLENIESLDAATGQFTCLTLWKTKEDEGGRGTV
jgi:hypothetical protein